MITFFTIPKPFSGKTAALQENAIHSWKALPGSEVLVFGDEAGTARAASAAGAIHVPEVTRNSYGTPLLDGVFTAARARAANGLLAYVNADILMLPGLATAAGRLLKSFGAGPFLAIGRRTDLNLDGALDFSSSAWAVDLAERAATTGSLHGWSGIDYFLFPRDFDPGIPPFPVGRPGWDNWFIGSTLSRGVPVVDATEVVTAVHQNHPPAYHPAGPEAADNIRLAGGLSGMCTIYNSTLLLTREGLCRPPAGRRVASLLLTRTPARYLLGLKRRLSFLLSR